MSYNDLRRGRVSEPSRQYFITTVVKNRVPVFADLRTARTLVQVMREMQYRGDLHWFAWVIMPDHFHALISLGAEKSLSRAVGCLKGASSRRVNESRGSAGRLWQPGFFDHALRKEEDVIEIARYIVANPLRAGLVEKLGDYPHWDSIWL